MKKLKRNKYTHLIGEERARKGGIYWMFLLFSKGRVKRGEGVTIGTLTTVRDLNSFWNIDIELFDDSWKSGENSIFDEAVYTFFCFKMGKKTGHDSSETVMYGFEKLTIRTSDSFSEEERTLVWCVSSVSCRKFVFKSFSFWIFQDESHCLRTFFTKLCIFFETGICYKVFFLIELFFPFEYRN